MRQPKLGTRKPAQLSFPFSWSANPANERDQTQAKRGGNRYRPSNDDCPFTAPGWEIPWYEAAGAHNAKRIE